MKYDVSPPPLLRSAVPYPSSYHSLQHSPASLVSHPMEHLFVINHRLSRLCRRSHIRRLTSAVSNYRGCCVWAPRLCSLSLSGRPGSPHPSQHPCVSLCPHAIKRATSVRLPHQRPPHPCLSAARPAPHPSPIYTGHPQVPGHSVVGCSDGSDQKTVVARIRTRL